MFSSFRLNTISAVAEVLAPTYNVAAAAGATSVNEGSSLTFNVTGTNITNGTYYYTVNSNAGDFGTSSGSFTITSNSGSFSVTPTADATTEGAETFTVSVRTDSTSGTVVATSVTITINDTSTTPAPTYAVAAAGGATSVNEGATLTFNVTTTNVANSTTLYWTMNNSTDFAVQGGSFTITSNSGSFSVTPTADVTTEGAETFVVYVRTVDVNGTIVATSATITINDTSTAPSSDAPTIPPLTWSGGGWITSTFNNTTAYRTSAFVGRRADGWHYLYGRADTSSQRLTHNNNVNLSQALGFTPTLVNSASMFSTTTARGGNTFVIASTATATRVSLGAVSAWTGTPTQTSAPVGAIGTSIARTSGTNSNTAIAISARNGDNNTRAIAFFTSGTTLMHGKYVATPGANTFTNASTSALSTGATVGTGNFMGAAGFTTNDGTGRWMVGGADGTNYKVSGGTTTDFSVATAGTTVWNQASALTATTLNGGGLAMAWDDYANSKFVGVAMVLDGTTIKARAIKWSDGTMGTANNSVATAAYQARICKVNSVSSGFGMVMITYLKAANGNTIYGRLVSVDSSTLALTVGAEFSLGVNGDSLAMSTTTGYGVDAVKDGTSWGFTAIWAAGSGGDGGAYLSTATG
jgi:hypothetical protein